MILPMTPEGGTDAFGRAEEILGQVVGEFVMNGGETGRLLPAPYSLRLAAPDDAEAIADLLVASADTLGMQSLVTAAELLTEWDRSHRCVVIGADGRVVGHATLSGRNAEGCVYPPHRGQGIGAYLVCMLEDLYQESLRSSGSAAGTLRHWVLGDGRAAHRLLTGTGYEPSRRDLQMIIDLDVAPPQPAWPPTVGVRPFGPGKDEGAVYRVYVEAWEMDLSFEADFLDRFVRRQSYDPSLWFLAVDGNDVIGAISAERTPSMGWIRQLSVLPSHHGRGIGTALLREAFGAFYASGVRHVRLGVDADNKTGAVNLYKHVGMHVACEYICYDKQLELA